MSDNKNIKCFTIPEQYTCVYTKLLIKMSELGIDMLKDCTSVCGGQNKFIITCWNMFQSACAAYELKQYKQADLIVDYIKKQLQLDCIASTGEETKYNAIYFGKTTNYTAEEFSKLTVTDVFNLDNDKIELTKVGINEITRQESWKLHYLIIPVTLVELIEVTSEGSGFVDYFWDSNNTEDSTYKVLDSIENIDGIIYKVYYSYSIETITTNISIKAKNK